MALRDNPSAEEPPRPTSRSSVPRASAPASKKAAATSKIRLKIDLSDDVEELTSLEKLKQRFFAIASGVGVSLAVHLVILMSLGLVVYRTSEGLEKSDGILASMASPEDLTRIQQKMAEVTQAVEIAAVALPSTSSAPKQPVKDDSPQPAQTPASNLDGPVGPAPQVGGALTGRTAEKKSSLLKMFGGTKQTEDAVGRGLGWLARQQQSDGRWELHRGYDNPGRENLRTDTGATSLALLSFLGAGYTHQEGKHKEVVRKGLTWLKKVQKADGNLHDWEELGRQTAFYAHGQGTIVLCEAYGLTQDETLLQPARKALQFIYDSQNENGGWQYQPGAVGDLSVTGWQVMAMQSARMAGIEVPEDVLARTSMFLNSVASEQGSRYRYKASDPSSGSSPAMTAEGLLCRQYLGWPKEHPGLQNGVSFLLEDQNLPRWADGRRNVYFWYYATQVMHHMEGDAWDRWNAALRDQIISNQAKSGKLAGSWHPSKPQGDDHEYGEAGGRLYVTCLSILTLEVYYRHLPLYRQAALPKE
ncbi:MAG: prenyltransferase/squalene oxidase repeat-containing protein [Planctomycetota bacterium]